MIVCSLNITSPGQNLFSFPPSQGVLLHLISPNGLSQAPNNLVSRLLEPGRMPQLQAPTQFLFLSDILSYLLHSFFNPVIKGVPCADMPAYTLSLLASAASYQWQLTYDLCCVGEEDDIWQVKSLSPCVEEPGRFPKQSFFVWFQMFYISVYA